MLSMSPRITQGYESQPLQPRNDQAPIRESAESLDEWQARLAVHLLH